MRFTLFKAALLAILSLGNTLIGTEGAPAGVAPFNDLFTRGGKFGGAGGAAKGGKGVGSGLDDIGGVAGTAGRGGTSGSGWGQVGQAGTKEIVNPLSLRYQYIPEAGEPRYTTGEGWTLIKVFGPDKDVKGIPLDVLGYNKNDGKMVVLQAWNSGDDAASRIPLRGILLSVWKTEAGGDVKNLKYIQYENVDEATVLQSIDDAYKAMGKSSADTKVLTVSAAGTAPGEQAAFQKLATGNPFGVGAQKMVADYAEMAGRHVVGFTIDRSKPGAPTTLIVNLS
ncbi:hypothetical protein CONLIGDRAFT_646502 [Coniochaeta ligniaria NRRL 30616]|uniref:Uncharacterized protein n=1 Tax=Coniochaeta ligniaria NRRL 30616 TaxID=1408157 RepID=A0A1J7IFY5_9PEZI|nr:hypothetical protein CONLIGDRAFT_646502 [Coniochaeta ligniaria NRRL 30616]